MTLRSHDGRLEVRDLTAEDHDAALGVRTRSFGALAPGARGWWTSVQEAIVAERRVVGVFDGDRLVGSAKARPFQQYWGGRPVPMAGIAGVVVLPEYRNRGVASLMLRGLVDRGRELGDAVSALYPAAVPPYRRSGWEVTGSQTRVTVDSAVLRGLDPAGVPVRSATRDDVDLIASMLAGEYERQRANGPKLLSRSEIEESVTDKEGFAYLTDDGFVLYEWDESDLVVRCLVAPTAATGRALWSVVGSGSSVAKQVHAYVGPHDPLPLLLPDEVHPEVRNKHWMSRVIDVEAAIALRGFAPAATGEVHLELDDPLVPGNAGSWRLDLADGRGSLVRDDGPAVGRVDPVDPVRLGPQGLAAWYAGSPLATLRAAGLAAGGAAADDDLLDAAVGGRPAYLLEYF